LKDTAVRLLDVLGQLLEAQTTQRTSAVRGWDRKGPSNFGPLHLSDDAVAMPPAPRASTRRLSRRYLSQAPSESCLDLVDDAAPWPEVSLLQWSACRRPEEPAPAERPRSLSQSSVRTPRSAPRQQDYAKRPSNPSTKCPGSAASQSTQNVSQAPDRCTSRRTSRHTMTPSLLTPSLLTDKADFLTPFSAPQDLDSSMTPGSDQELAVKLSGQVDQTTLEALHRLLPSGTRIRVTQRRPSQEAGSEAKGRARSSPVKGRARSSLAARTSPKDRGEATPHRVWHEGADREERATDLGTGSGAKWGLRFTPVDGVCSPSGPKAAAAEDARCNHSSRSIQPRARLSYSNATPSHSLLFSTVDEDGPTLEETCFGLLEEDEEEVFSDVSDGEMPLPPTSQSWDWPLSRPEKKCRVEMLGRNLLNAQRGAMAREVAHLRRRASMAPNYGGAAWSEEGAARRQTLV